MAEPAKTRDWEGPRFDKLRTLDNEVVSGKKYKVKIFTDERDSAGHVDLAVNGYNIRIRRGEEVIVDEAYVEVLKNAVVTSFRYDPDTNLRTPIERPMYPFSYTEVREPQAA